MTKVSCPTCHARYWDYELAERCCAERRKREDAETARKKADDLVSAMRAAVGVKA